MATERPFKNFGEIRLEFNLRWAEDNKYLSGVVAGLGLGLGLLSEVGYNIARQKGITVAPSVKRASRLLTGGMVGGGLLGVGFFEGMAQEVADEMIMRYKEGDPYMTKRLMEKIKEKAKNEGTVSLEDMKKE